jgi:hypothetical protein
MKWLCKKKKILLTISFVDTCLSCDEKFLFTVHPMYPCMGQLFESLRAIQILVNPSNKLLLIRKVLGHGRWTRGW